ncbi:hypothetical protein Bca52824_018920 [Brassica carinata]|uniref:TF-B3 domain-containing protein n=1 Tax=Brassica carinata TaxID=52824 RepID=A0A8X7VPS8_BRACI|nr:hypothetical protein Bca52824_018920 [Brassica carinata]
MGWKWNRGFGQVKEERKSLSFFKIFQNADLSSESMRGIPYDFMKNVSKEDFSCKMVIRTKWGRSWEVDISMNPRFYYMEKSGWNQFVSDNALGSNEFVTFTHSGLMCFNVNIYRRVARRLFYPTQRLHLKEESESSYKDVKKEDESMGGVEIHVKKKKKNAVEIGESSRGAALRNKKAEKHKKKKKKNVPRFKIIIRKSYLKSLYIKNESKVYKIHHSEGDGSWEVLSLVHQAHIVLSRGWIKLAREYPLAVGDRCTFHLVKPTEFVLTSKRPRP